MKPGIQKLSENLRQLLDGAEALLDGQAAGETREITGRARRVDAALHAHPWQALAATALVAFFAGRLLRRR